MMRVEKQFVVNAARDKVWAFLTDPAAVASCLPGTAITGQIDERTHTGTITMKVGPVSTSYRGEVHFERLDKAAGEAEIVAKGQEVRGKGGADMRMTSRLVERGPAATEVTVVSEVNVVGILAQMGRGVIQDVSDEMFQKFSDAMRSRLEGAPQVGTAAAAAQTAPPIEVLSLSSKIAARGLGRAVRRPVFWVVVLLMALVTYWLGFT